MKKIEFLGLPNAGKSFYFKKVRKFHKKTHNYESVFYFWLFKNNKINYISYKVITMLIFNEVSDYKKNKFLIFIKRKIYFFLKTKSSSEFKKQHDRIKKKYEKFFEKLKDLLKKHKDADRVSQLFVGILLGYDLAKIMKVDLISSEGVTQRLLGILLRKHISKKQLGIIVKYLPKPTHIIYFFKDKKKNIWIDEIEKIYQSKKVKFILIKNTNELYHKNIHVLSKILN